MLMIKQTVPICGQVVSVLAFYFNDPSSNLAEAKSFFYYGCVRNERN